MKKFITIILLTLLSVNLFANEITENTTSDKRSGLEVSTYFTNRYAVGDMATYLTTDIGGGVALEYTLPVLPILGFSVRAEGAYALPKTSRANNWVATTFSGGVFVNLPFGKIFTFRPELSYGAILNILNLDSKNTMFTDQIVQLSLSCRVKPSPDKNQGLSIELAPTYTLLTEKQDAVHYVGFRTGFNYNFK